MKNIIFFTALILVNFESLAQQIPNNRVLDIAELSEYLNEDTKQKLQGDSKVISSETLAAYFREQFSYGFFYNWENNNARFEEYAALYEEKDAHVTRALDHQNKYKANTVWQLPFNYKNGEAVDVYALRHLARQHKMVDVAMQYYYTGKDTLKVNYFKEQLKSLNTALKNNKVETIESGNGIYEVFRSGYRILNWLQIHNLYLGSEAYSDEDQLLTIATLLQHASDLYKTNDTFQAGNHQTRGMSALAMLSILFNDFKDADAWRERALDLLEQHLNKEINKDGFQFERSVHYHISDIENYFYVYQLAQNNKVKLSANFENKLRNLFSTLVKIAYPDKSAPVFSDDTDAPWAESNDISGTLTLGYLLFEDPEMGYFAKSNVSSKIYWFLKKEQLDKLKTIKSTKPSFGSLQLPETGYYVMRGGWDKNDAMLVISAGLDAEKPDHQHGDMLGLQIFANERVILPNYQVRYSLEDLELFKNSEVKNVSLVDTLLQGVDYKSNKGGSGFGKFGSLPQPETLLFDSTDSLDVYIGKHSGFEENGVEYSRQVLFIDTDFWIVKDNFSSANPHNYKQVWQGHYTLEEAPQLLRSSFDNGSGLDIYQLQEVDTVSLSGKRGKEWAMPKVSDRTNFSFVTAVVPFKTYLDRIDETSSKPTIKDWSVVYTPTSKVGIKTIQLNKANKSYFFNVINTTVSNLKFDFIEPADVIIEKGLRDITIRSLSTKEILFTYQDSDSNIAAVMNTLKMGASIKIEMKK